eukprot:gene4783-8369_t
MFRLIRQPTKHVFKNQIVYYGKESISKLEKGEVIKNKNKYVQILNITHQKIARGGALFNVEFLDISNGKKFNEVLKPTNHFETVETKIENVTFQNINKEGNYIFLDEDENEIEIQNTMIPNNKKNIFNEYLNEKEDIEFVIRFVDDVPILVQFPIHLSDVLERKEGVSGILRNKLKISKVPNHVSIGDRIVFRTDDFTYVSREN